MAVKHWSRAGILLTDWCNARCACCYVNCTPERRTWMTPQQAVSVWESLISASPHGCRVHLTGGEVFGNFDLLLDICLQAQRHKLQPLESVETNGFWALDERIIVQRVRALDQAGMQQLAISADPYHQQFVPIERARLLARVASELLGRHRVKVRWQDWLETGSDCAELTHEDRQRIFDDYAAGRRERLIGRAAACVGGRLPLKPPSAMDDTPCRERLLRSRHVHIAPTGEVWLGTCVGISAGNAFNQSIDELWQSLSRNWADRPLIGPLCLRGPSALADLLEDLPADLPETAGRCHLCYEMRKLLHRQGRAVAELGPALAYDDGNNS